MLSLYLCGRSVFKANFLQSWKKCSTFLRVELKVFRTFLKIAVILAFATYSQITCFYVVFNVFSL